jgi:hypothetical protein
MQVIYWIIDPPGWSIVPLIAVGLALIYWDTRRRRPSNTDISPTNEVQKKSQVVSEIMRSPLQVYQRNKGRIRHNMHMHGGALLVGPKAKQFTLRFSIAAADIVHLNRGNLEYLGRIRGKQKGEILRISDFPNSPGFRLESGERFIARNGSGYMLQGRLVGAKDDRNADYDEVTFDYSISEDASEFVAI